MNVAVSRFRAELPKFLKLAQRGVEIRITSRGRDIARLLPAESDRQQAARELKKLAKNCRIGDLLSPDGKLSACKAVEAIW